MKATILSLVMVTILVSISHATEVSSKVNLAGTWNVTSTYNEDDTCQKDSKFGDTAAYMWIISQSSDGLLTINVQGETSFPKLIGAWRKDNKYLIVKSKNNVLSEASVWFKLSLNEKGELVGIRRFVSQRCFADSDVTAKRQ